MNEDAERRRDRIVGRLGTALEALLVVLVGGGALWLLRGNFAPFDTFIFCVFGSTSPSGFSHGG
jgi:hypothetical protein